MAIWWLLLFCNLICPIVMILGGWFMWKHCPKTINPWVGYRSKRSMKNDDTWQFASENCGRRWWRLGWLMLIPTVLLQLFFCGKDTDSLGRLTLFICMVGCSVMILSILPTERALKRTFNEDGTRKEAHEQKTV